MRIAEGTIERLVVGPDEVTEILGGRRFESETAMRTSVPGVATGLAWTPVGGDILFIEATRTPGNGRLILTGQLGDVMKESAQAALSLVKSRPEVLGTDPVEFDKFDIHVHVPAGAIPKDGPSAGVAMFMALVSLLTGRTIRSDLAMTGEISLRGLVLPVGGIKEKVLAAQRAGITTVMLPARNRRDYEEIPEAARDGVELRLAGAGGRRDSGGVGVRWSLRLKLLQRRAAAEPERGDVPRGGPAHRVGDDALNIGVVVCRVGFVAGAEVEDPAQPPRIAAAAAEDLAALEPAYEHQLVRGRDVERFAVHFLRLQVEVFGQALGDRVASGDRPDPLPLARDPVFQVAGGAHQAVEDLGEMRGMQRDQPHSRQHPRLDAVHDGVIDLMVMPVTPPEQDIGFGQDGFGQPMLRLILRGGTHRKAGRAQGSRQGFVDVRRGKWPPHRPGCVRASIRSTPSRG